MSSIKNYSILTGKLEEPELGKRKCDLVLSKIFENFNKMSLIHKNNGIYVFQYSKNEIEIYIIERNNCIELSIHTPVHYYEYIYDDTNIILKYKELECKHPEYKRLNENLEYFEELIDYIFTI